MVGTAISAGLGIVGGLANLLGGTDADEEYRNYIKSLKQEKVINDNLDATKTATGNRILSKLEEQNQDASRQARAAQSLGLQTSDATVAALNNRAKGMADAASSIQATGDAMKQQNGAAINAQINQARSAQLQQRIAQGSEISKALAGLSATGMAISNGLGKTKAQN